MLLAKNPEVVLCLLLEEFAEGLACYKLGLGTAGRCFLYLFLEMSCQLIFFHLSESSVLNEEVWWEMVCLAFTL